MKTKKNTILRIPRTSGLTRMSQSLNDPTQTRKGINRILQKIQDTILNRYVLDGYTLNGKLIDLYSIAEYIQLPIKKVLKKITKHVRQLSLMNNTDTTDSYRALIGMALKGVIEASHITRQQVTTLQLSQGTKYVAYLSPALNSAIKNLIDSNRPLLEIAKLLQPNTIPAMFQINQNNTVQTNLTESIGPNEAVKLIDERRDRDLLANPDAQANLYTKYLESHEEIPEILATKQQGFRLDAGSLISGKPQIKSLPTHHDRREEDGTITD